MGNPDGYLMPTMWPRGGGAPTFVYQLSFFRQCLGESPIMAGYKSKSIRMEKRVVLDDHKFKRKRCASFSIQNGYVCSNLSCLVGMQQKDLSTSKQKCVDCYAADHTKDSLSGENIPKTRGYTE
ncbi:hypothetical protein HAX54_005693 [Datura stramonium]|uniref:Uncharacterized protein n=1 Tax=Datura stramonium TaxID=4076 RepID=A0ABS8TAU4_DATST|nr:hypothetical protein [Datura stramonium]